MCGNWLGFRARTGRMDVKRMSLLNSARGGQGGGGGDCFCCLLPPNMSRCRERALLKLVLLVIVGGASWVVGLSLPDNVGMVSHRDASTKLRGDLLEKARQINRRKGPLGDGTHPAYSNRAQLALTPVAEGVYTADRPFYWNSIDV